MKSINEMGDDERIELKSTFQRSMIDSHRILGDEAFRKRYLPEASKSPISKALFETWSVAFANLSKEKIDYLARNRDIIQKKFMETLRNDRDFEISISYSTGLPVRVHKRFLTIEKLVGGVLDDA